MSMSQKRIYEFFKNPKNIKVSRTSVNDSTTTNSVSSSTTGGPVNVGSAVHSANVIPSAAKPRNLLIKIHLNISMVAPMFITFGLHWLFCYLFLCDLRHIYHLPINLTVVRIKVIKVIKLMQGYLMRYFGL